MFVVGFFQVGSVQCPVVLLAEKTVAPRPEKLDIWESEGAWRGTQKREGQVGFLGVCLEHLNNIYTISFHSFHSHLYNLIHSFPSHSISPHRPLPLCSLMLDPCMASERGSCVSCGGNIHLLSACGRRRSKKGEHGCSHPAMFWLLHSV